MLGLAVSFGSQSLVRDIVSGIFFLAEDSFRVGEYIDGSKVKGTVEGFSVRSIRLRHQNGQLNIVPFGQLTHITNFSRDWTTVKFNLAFAPNTDVELLRKTVKKIGLDMMNEPQFQKELLQPLKMQGLVDIKDGSLIVRFKFTAKPQESEHDPAHGDPAHVREPARSSASTSPSRPMPRRSATSTPRRESPLSNPSNRSDTMEKRKLGKSGLEFAPIAFGGNVFGWTADEATSHKLLDAFVDAGFSFIDTADVYSRWVPGHKGGESEAIIGTWLKKDPSKRDKVLIATKCGMVPAEGALTRAHIKKSVDESLQRMNTDRIDLFQSHKDDKATPLEETLETYGELVKAGKLRSIGASNYDAPRLAEAAKISKDKGLPRYESLQPHYNLMERGLFEGALEDECLKEGIGVIPYYSLASGFLSGKYRAEVRCRQRPARCRREEVHQPQGHGRAEGARRRRQEAQRQPDAGDARLADAEEVDHRADRQRHQPAAAQGPDRLAERQARRGGRRRPRQGQRALVIGARHSSGAS